MAIPYEQQFHFRDGSSVSSLEGLKNHIETISYQEFYHHVNSEKNDFANWIQYVLRQELLAADLRKVTSIVETVEIINDYLHPQPITAPRLDNQSRIEQAIYADPFPPEADKRVEQFIVEQTPAEVHPVEEPLDFAAIEQKVGITEHTDTTVREELFGHTPMQPPQLAPPVEHVDADATRMIVKDFMYGLVFGLLIGLILGRIIS